MIKSARIGLLVIAAALAAAVAVRLLAPQSSMGTAPLEWSLLLRLRWGAVASAATAGACLGTSGLLLQALLRNPLASPFILGLSSGAGLGVAVGVWLSAAGLGIAAAFGGIIPAAVGSLLSLALVWGFGRKRGALDPLTMVLAGICIGAIASALTLLIESLIPPEARLPISNWMMGRIPELPPLDVLGFGICALLGGTLLSWRLSSAIDVASTSDHETISMGVDLPRLRFVMFLASGVLAAAAVVLVGPIAFVGFVAPHAARLLLGSRHQALAIAAPMAGATLLIAADAIRQALDVGAGRVPIGVLTALAGGPVFLFLLKRTRWVGDA